MSGLNGHPAKMLIGDKLIRKFESFILLDILACPIDKVRGCNPRYIGLNPIANSIIMQDYSVDGGGADCKSVVFNGSGGSTPSSCTEIVVSF